MARQARTRPGRTERPVAAEPATDPRAGSDRALAALLARKVGWGSGGKANAGERESSGPRRLPLEGLTGGDFPSRRS